MIWAECGPVLKCVTQTRVQNNIMYRKRVEIPSSKFSLHTFSAGLILLRSNTLKTCFRSTYTMKDAVISLAGDCSCFEFYSQFVQRDQATKVKSAFGVFFWSLMMDLKLEWGEIIVKKSMKRVKYTVQFWNLAKVVTESDVLWKKFGKKFKYTSYENVNIFSSRVLCFQWKKKREEKAIKSWSLKKSEAHRSRAQS